MHLRRLITHFRIWRHRRKAKWWYDEYLWRNRAIQAHQRAKPHCLAQAHALNMEIKQLEAESKA